MKRVTVNMDEATEAWLQRFAAQENRSLSQAALVLIQRYVRTASSEAGLGGEDVAHSSTGEHGRRSTDEGRASLASRSPDVSSPPSPALEEGDPGIESVLSAGSPDASGMVGSSSSSVWQERLDVNRPKAGSCPRVLSHRKGEFCKSCGEMF